MKSLDERPLWGSQGNTPEGILFQLSWEKVLPYRHPHTHSHSLPKFLQPYWAAPPLSTHSHLCIKTKTKTKQQQGSVPHCIKYLLFSAPGPNSPHHRFTYIHILTQCEHRLAAFLWAETLRITPSLTLKEAGNLSKWSRDLVPLSTEKTKSLGPGKSPSSDWGLCSHSPPDFMGIHCIKHR